MFPALAVAKVLRESGHHVLFVGTAEGMEARLVPEAGYPIEFVRSGQLNRVGLRRQIGTALRLPGSVLSARTLLRRVQPDAVFSMGGYVAGPVMAAAAMSRVPLVLMEPNAIPGFANRKMAAFVYRALLGFEGTSKWFPAGKSEVTGVPVRAEFFAVTPKNSGKVHAAGDGRKPRGAQPEQGLPGELAALSREWGGGADCASSGCHGSEHAGRENSPARRIDGEVVPFIRDMAEAFAQADLVVGRSGAGGVNEIAAAGMASVLVPFPFSADDHQTVNAETLVAAGAARMVPDRELDGERLFREVEELRRKPGELERMRGAVKQFAKPRAAERAAAILEEAAQRKKN